MLHFFRPKDWQLKYNNNILAFIGAKKRFSRFFEAEYEGQSIRLEHRPRDDSVSIISLNTGEEIGIIVKLSFSWESSIIFANGQKFVFRDVKEGWAFSEESGSTLAITNFNNMKSPMESKFTLLKQPNEEKIHPGLIAVLSQYYALQKGLGY
ncbi:MAG: hypothetical protein LLG16_09520 [Euryarchaeota archaeon]|nr:hypothetical protein [Euryarchaeota archaeon]